MVPRTLLFCWAFFFVSACAASRAAETERGNLFFTDERVSISVAPAEAKKIAFTLSVLTARGMEHLGKRSAAVENHSLQISPEKEGVHIVRFEDGSEYRFLAIAPPKHVPKGIFADALPQSLSRLESGAPYVIGAYGDSVTQTGAYPEILAMLIERALGHPGQIRIVRKANPGRSIDATIRQWDKDVASDPPDLALIMYGLNDQAAGLSLDAYLEQSSWLAGRFRAELRSDVIFLQPTPHIDVFEKSGDAGELNAPDYAFRTIAFASALGDLAKNLGVKCAETFQAIWGEGGPSLLESARNMKPLYPPSYSRQMESMLEVASGGDTIHPNILGHLAIARSVFETMTGSGANSWPIGCAATSSWKAGKPVSQLEILNRTDRETDVAVSIHAMPDRELAAQKNLHLKAGERHVLDVPWPGINSPDDLLTSPAGRELAANRGILAVVSTIGGKTRVEGVIARFDSAPGFKHKRFETLSTSLEMPVEGTQENVSANIPPGAESGKIPLLIKVDGKDGESWAAAELWFVRHAWAESGEARLDGNLDEWAGEGWSTLGTGHHARWVKGPEDYRTSPEECSLQFAFKAGSAGLYMAIRGQGDFSRDDFTLFFDPRDKSDLGTPGPYYWVGGSFSDRSKIALKNGETSPAQPIPDASALQAPEGSNIEIFIPYQVMNISQWPSSGDLGFSFLWNHREKSGKTTHLLWSDKGHPWNPRWHGVIRRQNSSKDLPFMVRVE